MRKDSHLRRFVGYIHHGVPLDRLNFPGKILLVHVSDFADAKIRCILPVLVHIKRIWQFHKP
jgi:hypothetical protein